MFLSGGLDSSIVLHHMAKHAHDVRTFSVDFEMVSGAEHETDKFNTDARLAEKTARTYGAHHITHRLPLSFVRTELEHVVGALDEPVANPTAISQYFLSKRVREDGVVVALGGDGGDELFLGYTRHRMLMASYEFQRLPHPLRIILGRMHSRIAKLNIPLGHEIHMAVMANKVESIMPYLRTNEHPHSSLIRLLDSRYREVGNNRHPLATFMHVDRGTWLPDESLHRTDRTGMAHGLELRVPLVDLDVVTLADIIPVEKKLTPFTGKKILREAYRKHLPAHLFSQPKRGWVSPGAKWLRDREVLETVKAVLSPAYYDGLSELYDWESIQGLLTAHVEKKTYALYPLWNLFVLQVWARKHHLVYER
jgi:asparagine synthase (glutamine-hydrolysing)